MDEQSSLIVLYKRRSEDGQSKYLAIEKLVHEEQEAKERLTREWDRERVMFISKKNELEAKSVGLVEICTENDREV